MFVILSSVKGGVGTSVTAAALSLVLAKDTTNPIYLIDLGDGDQPDIVGLPAQPEGLVQWLASPDRRLTDLAVDVIGSLRLIPRGEGSLPTDRSWMAKLALALDELRSGAHVIIDAGTLDTTIHLDPLADRRLMVMRPCYVGLRRVVSAPANWDGMILVRPPDRVLTTRDVMSVCDIPLAAEVIMTPEVSRIVDAGVFRSRVPHGLARALRPILTEHFTGE